MDALFASPLSAALFGAMLAGLAFFGVRGGVAFAARRRIDARLEAGGERGQNGKRGPSFVESLGRRVADPKSEDVSKIRARMIRAGYFSKSAPFVYLGLRFVSLILPVAGLALFWPTLTGVLPQHFLLLAACGATAVGYLAPSLLLDRRIEKLEQQYRDGFPDMMDLMVACVQAGLSLDAAVARVCEELHQRYPDLARHLQVMNLEMRAGRDRNDAWKNFAQRVGLDEARSLATMLKQSEVLGTSIGETLSVFAVDMRERRMLLAEEKALALPAKLVMPLIGFVFPTLLVVLLLPAIVRMIWVFERQG